MLRNRPDRASGAQPPQRSTKRPQTLSSPGRLLILESPTYGSAIDISEPINFSKRPQYNCNTLQSAEPLFQDTYLSSEEEPSPLTPETALSAQWSFDTMPHIWITPDPQDDDYASDYSDPGYDSLPEDTTNAQTLSYYRYGKPKMIEIPQRRPAASPPRRAPASISRNSSISTTDHTIFTEDSSSKPSTAASSISEYHNISPKLHWRASKSVPQQEMAPPEIDLKPFRRSHQQRPKTSLDRIEERHAGQHDTSARSWASIKAHGEDAGTPFRQSQAMHHGMAHSQPPSPALRRSRKSVANFFTKR